MLQKISSDTFFRPIFFNPNFPVAQHDMNGCLSNPVVFRPPNFTQNVLTVLVVKS